MPTPGPARVIGGPANGCLAGAAALPADGPGYAAIRLGRHRNYGHPDTIAYVERLGRAAQAAHLAPFYVGDMAQPRGGPMPSGHGSHMNGMDVDIWFNLDAKPDLPPVAREEVELPSMVLPDRRDIDPSRFGESQVRLLRLAASDAHVDRIFVHPTIKRANLDERVGPVTAAAMSHSRRHEETDTLVGLRGAKHFLNASEILDCVEWRDVLIGPAVIHQQLATTSHEFLKVWIGGVHDEVFGAFEAVVVLVEIERAPIPSGILKHHVLCLIEDRRVWLWPAAHDGPA